MRGLILLAVLPLAACATPAAPPPRIVTVEVAVPVSSPCVPASLAAPPEYPDTDAALRAAPDAASRYQLTFAGRLLRMARLNEVEPIVAACPKAPR
jgi:hypothetical protein